jgi:hypothetical protein
VEVLRKANEDGQFNGSRRGRQSWDVLTIITRCVIITINWSDNYEKAQTRHAW